MRGCCTNTCSLPMVDSYVRCHPLTLPYLSGTNWVSFACFQAVNHGFAYLGNSVVLSLYQKVF
jgi:hypothetical protein